MIYFLLCIWMTGAGQATWSGIETVELWPTLNIYYDTTRNHFSCVLSGRCLYYMYTPLCSYWNTPSGSVPCHTNVISIIYKLMAFAFSWNYKRHCTSIYDLIPKYKLSWKVHLIYCLPHHKNTQNSVFHKSLLFLAVI